MDVPQSRIGQRLRGASSVVYPLKTLPLSSEPKEPKECLQIWDKLALDTYNMKTIQEMADGKLKKMSSPRKFALSDLNSGPLRFYVFPSDSGGVYAYLTPPCFRHCEHGPGLAQRRSTRDGPVGLQQTQVVPGQRFRFGDRPCVSCGEQQPPTPLRPGKITNKIKREPKYL